MRSRLPVVVRFSQAGCPIRRLCEWGFSPTFPRRWPPTSAEEPGKRYSPPTITYAMMPRKGATDDSSSPIIPHLAYRLVCRRFHQSSRANSTAAAQLPQAGEPSPPAQNPPLARLAPYQAIEDAASAMKLGDVDSIRAVVEAIFNVLAFTELRNHGRSRQTAPHRRPARLSQRQNRGNPRAQRRRRLNTLATKLDLPDSGMVTSPPSPIHSCELRLFDASIHVQIRVQNQTRRTQSADVPAANDRKLAAGLIDLRKLPIPIIRPLPPNGIAMSIRDWSSKSEPVRAAQTHRSRRGKAPNKGPLVARSIGPDNPMMIVRRRLSSMSLADGLKQFNQTFTQLGI